MLTTAHSMICSLHWQCYVIVYSKQVYTSCLAVCLNMYVVGAALQAVSSLWLYCTGRISTHSCQRSKDSPVCRVVVNADTILLHAAQLPAKEELRCSDMGVQLSVKFVYADPWTEPPLSSIIYYHLCHLYLSVSMHGASWPLTPAACPFCRQNPSREPRKGARPTGGPDADLPYRPTYQSQRPHPNNVRELGARGLCGQDHRKGGAGVRGLCQGV